MAQIEVSCAHCNASDYQLLDPKTGEVLCPYCRNKWIVPDLIQKTETEKFLEEQSKQPRVVFDNTSETDRELMNAMGGIASMLGRNLSGGCLASVRRMVGALIGGIVVLVVAFVLLMLALRYFTAS